MQPRGIFYIRITAAVFLILLLVGGVYDSVQAHASTVAIGTACLPQADTLNPHLPMSATAQSTVASAGAPFGFTVTYPTNKQLLDQGYDIWRLAGATTATPQETPLQEYALYMGHERITNPTAKTTVVWQPPADFPTGTYELVPTATDAQTKLAISGSPVTVTLSSEIPTNTYLVPGAGTSSIASNPGSQAATVLVVGDLINTTAADRTVKVTWSVTDPTNSTVKAESYYNTVTVPAHTSSMEIAHTFNRSPYAVMLVSGAVLDGDVTSTSYFRLTGLQRLHFDYTDVSVIHTSGFFSDTYVVTGCVAAPPITYADLVSQPITVSYTLGGVTTSEQIGEHQSGSTMSFTSERSLLASKTSIPVTIKLANGETMTITVPASSAHLYGIWRIVGYSLLSLLLLLLVIMPRRRRMYMEQP